MPRRVDEYAPLGTESERSIELTGLLALEPTRSEVQESPRQPRAPAAIASPSLQIKSRDQRWGASTQTSRNFTASVQRGTPLPHRHQNRLEHKRLATDPRFAHAAEPSKEQGPEENAKKKEKEQMEKMEKEKFKFGEIYFEESGRTVPYILVPDNPKGKDPKKVFEALRQADPTLPWPEITFQVRATKRSYFEFAQEIYDNPVLAEAWGWRSHPQIFIALDRALTVTQKEKLVGKIPELLEYPKDQLHLSAEFTLARPDIIGTDEVHRSCKERWDEAAAESASQHSEGNSRWSACWARTGEEEKSGNEKPGDWVELELANGAEFLTVKLLKVPKDIVPKKPNDDPEPEAQPDNNQDFGVEMKKKAIKLAYGIRDYFKSERKVFDVHDTKPSGCLRFATRSREFIHPVYIDQDAFMDPKYKESTAQHIDDGKALIIDSDVEGSEYVELFTYGKHTKDAAIRDFSDRILKVFEDVVRGVTESKGWFFSPTGRQASHQLIGETIDRFEAEGVTWVQYGSLRDPDLGGHYSDEHFGRDNHGNLLKQLIDSSVDLRYGDQKPQAKSKVFYPTDHLRYPGAADVQGNKQIPARGPDQSLDKWLEERYVDMPLTSGGLHPQATHFIFYDWHPQATLDSKHYQHKQEDEVEEARETARTNAKIFRRELQSYLREEGVSEGFMLINGDQEDLEDTRKDVARSTTCVIFMCMVLMFTVRLVHLSV